MSKKPDPTADEEAFANLYRQFGRIVDYANRRGSMDAEAIAAETMAIAWRRLEALEGRDAVPWLITTARNLLHEEYRSRRRSDLVAPTEMEELDSREVPDLELRSLEPEVDRALALMSPTDRETLLLIAWEDLTPSEAAESLGVSSTAFRVRLHRARRKFKRLYAGSDTGLAATKPSPV